MKAEPRTERLAIGISGDSATGKSYLASGAVAVLGSERCRVINGDDYHRWERGSQEWSDITHLHPDANEISALESDLKALRSGTPVRRPRYDHDDGRFVDDQVLEPRKWLLVEGLHGLYSQGVRDQLALRVFLSPHRLVQLSWLLHRDVDARGHRGPDVLRRFYERAEDRDRFILPQREHAQLIISYAPVGDATMDGVLAGDALSYVVRYRAKDPALVSSLEALAEHLLPAPGGRFALETETGGTGDRGAVTGASLELRHAPSATSIQSAAAALEAESGQVCSVDETEPRGWRRGLQAVDQLVVLALCCQLGRTAREA